MKLNKYCVALGTFFIVAPLQAVEVYKSDLLNFEIGGNLQLGVLNQDGSDGEKGTTVFDNGSRTSFDFSSQLNPDLKLRSFVFVNVNAVARNSGIDNYNLGSKSISISSGSDDFMSLREGFFSVEHSLWGEFSIGKREAAYVAVTEITDVLNVYSAMASSAYVYGDGGITGTGRVDNGIYWNKVFDIDKHAITLNLQGQFLDDVTTLRDEDGFPLLDGNGNEISLKANGGEGASLLYSYDSQLITLGLGYVNSDVQGRGINVNDPQAYAGSFSFSKDDWYFAAVSSHSEGMYQDDSSQIFEGNGYEVVLSKRFGDWTPMIGWNHIEPDDYVIGTGNQKSQYNLDMFVLSLNYNIDSIGFTAFVEGMIDNGQNADGSDSSDDYISVGMYYPF
jgi:hypothetical protein